jgi:hypothetical protein
VRDCAETERGEVERNGEERSAEEGGEGRGEERRREGRGGEEREQVREEERGKATLPRALPESETFPCLPLPLAPSI